MAKKSLVREAQETVLEAAKTGVAVARLAATAGLAAAGPAAASVVLESVSKRLKSAEETVANVTPGEASEALGIMPASPRKRTTRKEASRKAEEASSQKQGCSKEAIRTQAKKESEQDDRPEESSQKQAWDAPAQALSHSRIVNQWYPPQCAGCFQHNSWADCTRFAVTHGCRKERLSPSASTLNAPRLRRDNSLDCRTLSPSRTPPWRTSRSKS